MVTVTENICRDLSDKNHNATRVTILSNILDSMTDIPPSAQFDVPESRDRERFGVVDIDYLFRRKQSAFSINVTDNSSIVADDSSLEFEIVMAGQSIFTTLIFVASLTDDNQILIGSDESDTEDNIVTAITNFVANVAASISDNAVSVISNYQLSISYDGSGVEVTDVSDEGDTPAAKLQICFYNGNHGDNGSYSEDESFSLIEGQHTAKFDSKGRSFGLRLIDMTNAAIDWVDWEVGGWKTLGR